MREMDRDGLTETGHPPPRMRLDLYHTNETLKIMTNISFKRQIPIASLYREVTEWNRNNNDRGITRLTTELCDAFSHYDPGWMGEEGWTDALDQFVYVEYLVKDVTMEVQVVEAFSSVDEMEKYEGKPVCMIVRSCEDDICMEILASDVMVRYCVAENTSEELWQVVVKETAVLQRLYELNGKGTDAFWNELLLLNAPLGVISEKPKVKVFLDNEELAAFDYDTAIPLPHASGDKMQVFHNGQLREYIVIERSFRYEHPFSKLTEIHLRMSNIQ